MWRKNNKNDERRRRLFTDHLRGENFDLRIRIGDLESDSADSAQSLGAQAGGGGAGAGAGAVRGDGDRVGVLATRESVPQGRVVVVDEFI